MVWGLASLELKNYESSCFFVDCKYVDGTDGSRVFDPVSASRVYIQLQTLLIESNTLDVACNEIAQLIFKLEGRLVRSLSIFINRDIKV